MPRCDVAAKGPCVCIAMHPCAPRTARSMRRMLLDEQGRIGLADCPHALNMIPPYVLRYCFQTAASQMGKLSMQQVLFSHAWSLDCNHYVCVQYHCLGRVCWHI